MRGTAEGGCHCLRWPVLRRYEREWQRAISLPLGGIGTGTIGFGGRGQLRDWELQNHPAKGSTVPGTFFAVRAAGPALAPVGRLLEGGLFPEEYEGALGSPAPQSGMPRFAHCTFETAYPFAVVNLDDGSYPLSVRLGAFNPLLPGDAEASGLPIIFWRVHLHNKTAEPLDVSVMLSLANFIGGRLRTAGGPDLSRPTLERRKTEDLVGVLLGDDGFGPEDEERGTFAAAVLGDKAAWTGRQWAPGKWGQGFAAMWRSFLQDGHPGLTGGSDGHPFPGSDGVPAATLGTARRLGPMSSTDVELVFGWCFPYRRGWTFSGPGPAGGPSATIVGNWYAAGLEDAWAAVEHARTRARPLEAATQRFVSEFLASDLDPMVQEAALFNLSTLRSPTVFRAADGTPYGWEGVLDHAGSCPGSCTHVWNYEFATPFLFSDLAKRAREVEFDRATDENGAMGFRVGLEEGWDLAAADGQFGCIVKLYREWQLSGDIAFLARLWPAAKRALEFAWLPGSWDADQDGVAEGALHNTLDIEYYGPTPLIQGWYLAALGAGARMAEHLGDDDFARQCRRLAERGSQWTEDHLFNGEYYQQEVRAPGDFSLVRPETRHHQMGAQDPAHPEYQMGSGCLVDQLAGQVSAEIAGLGKVFDPVHAMASLASVHRLNYVARFADWTNYMRSFALGEDRGHIILAYPDGVPEHPMPYWCEVMTGYEYTYALALAQAGLDEQAVDVVRSIRDRYDGKRRNPFDEAECGHHYARAMASWGLVNALTGFHYSAVDARMEFATGRAGSRWLWATGPAWGTIEQWPGACPLGRLAVVSGSLQLGTVAIGPATFDLATRRVLVAGDVLDLPLPAP